MNILITNDDGYTASGLLAAYQAVQGLGKVHVVAPAQERSACSHQITLKRPITVQRATRDPFGMIHIVDGTPADCVRLGVAELLDSRVDLVISGINQGANAGVDVFYSGTVAGAREGAILGIRSIALSQALRSGVDTDWTRTAEAAGHVISLLRDEELPGPGFWSVNLPAPVPASFRDCLHRVPVAIEPAPMDFVRSEADDGSGIQYRYGPNNYWTRTTRNPTDYSVLKDGGVAISAIPLIRGF